MVMECGRILTFSADEHKMKKLKFGYYGKKKAVFKQRKETYEGSKGFP